MLPDLNRLRVFYEVYRARSVVRAAKAMHVTQSAISQQLKNLELELGLTLIPRNNRQLLPSPEGQILFDTMELFLKDLEGKIKDISSLRSEAVGTIRIAAPYMFGSQVLVQLIARFVSSHPKVNFEISLERWENALQFVVDHKTDFAFADDYLKETPKKSPAVMVRIPVFSEEISMLASSKYYKEHLGGKLNYETLSKCAHIEYQPGEPVIRTWYAHHFRKRDPQVPVALRVESVAAVIAAVKANIGLGVVPAYLVANEIKQKQLRLITSSKTELVNQIAMFHLRDKNLTRAQALFLDFAVSELKRGL